MTLTHDSRRQHASLCLHPPSSEVATVALGPGILADVNEAGRVCGIELLDANAQLAPQRPSQA